MTDMRGIMSGPPSRVPATRCHSWSNWSSMPSCTPRHGSPSLPTSRSIPLKPSSPNSPHFYPSNPPPRTSLTPTPAPPHPRTSCASYSLCPSYRACVRARACACVRMRARARACVRLKRAWMPKVSSTVSSSPVCKLRVFSTRRAWILRHHVNAATRAIARIPTGSGIPRTSRRSRRATEGTHGKTQQCFGDAARARKDGVEQNLIA